MKYGIYYAYWEKQWGADYLKYVKKVKDLGFDILEISCAGLKETPAEEIAKLKSYKDEHGVILTGGYGPKAIENIASADPAIVQNTFAFWKDTFKVLAELDIHQVGGGLYSYWPVDYSKPIDKAADLNRSITNMKELAKMAAEYDITLGMEVLNRHEGYLLNTAAEAVAYVDAVGADNVKIMLDTYHMSMEEDSFVDAILTAGHRLGHLHVGENNRKLPGQGTMIPWEEIGEALHKVNYDGTVVMEPFVIDGGEVGRDIRVWRKLKEDCSEAALDREAAESVKYLRGVFEK